MTGSCRIETKASPSPDTVSLNNTNGRSPRREPRDTTGRAVINLRSLNREAPALKCET